MNRIAFAVPGDLNTATGGYAYDRRLIAELEALGHPVEVVGLGDGFPHPDEGQRAFAAAALTGIPDRRPTLVDGLALGVLPDEAAMLAARAPLIALVHHPLAWETGLTPARRQALQASETRALARAHAVVTTSRTTASTLADHFQVSPARLSVAEPGVDVATRIDRDPDPPARLLAVGALVPRKGYDVLVGALARIRHLDWQLDIVGDPDRDPATAKDLSDKVAAAGLGDRIRISGRVDAAALEAHYRAANIFVISSRYEGYGMVVTEAIAHGLPIVGTAAGALTETIPDAAGLKVPPDDEAALAKALERLIGDPALRGDLAAGTRDAAGRLPKWSATARHVSDVIEGLCRDVSK
ncbi:glycosyltransferase family 4 protein [Amorphus orientalis]|uniref:Glycosyltransferase involved in cell wall biosynthesis n=1 Tax=Amorphus orientalis TaxID=649198 RepID=A0AAE3VQ48_9HYPH|nr:glycosyltransferase family 4 protein [Amorphus orientalis]MDQ0315993.1 glycosyltransferase involved in cell wall biosynthesis [Amorphus orientalis]